MELFLSATGSLALVKSVVDLLKYFRAKDTNGWVTQIVVWLSGVGAAVLLAASDLAETFKLNDAGLTLGNANGATVALVGLGIGSSAMLANEFKKAIDRNDSAAKPDLVGPVSDHVVAPPK